MHAAAVDAAERRCATDQKSNSPARTPATNAAHSAALKRSTSRSGSFESRMETDPAAGATSTHSADSQYRLRRHTSVGWVSVTRWRPFSQLSHVIHGRATLAWRRPGPA